MLARDKAIDTQEFLILRTPFDNSFKYYLDDTATMKKFDIYACFVLKNIPPTALTIMGSDLKYEYYSK
jgi:hypothetical protein